LNWEEGETGKRQKRTSDYPPLRGGRDGQGAVSDASEGGIRAGDRLKEREPERKIETSNDVGEEIAVSRYTGSQLKELREKIRQTMEGLIRAVSWMITR